MASLFVAPYFVERPEITDQAETQLLQLKEQVAIGFDVLVVITVVALGVLALTQIHGLADLGKFAGIGSIGSNAAQALIGGGAGLLVLVTVKYMQRQGAHITALTTSRATILGERNTSRASELRLRSELTALQTGVFEAARAATERAWTLKLENTLLKISEAQPSAANDGNGDASSLGSTVDEV